jgi:tetratricopeptide (TPR) repeat protein
MPQSWLLLRTTDMVRIRAAIVAVCLGAVVSACGELPKGATDYLIAGNEAFKRNDYKEAEVDYRNALKADPTSGVALNNLGVILNELGKYDESIEILHQATAKDPNNIIAHYTLSQALAKKGDYDAAIAEAKLAIAAPKGNEELGAHKALAQASLLKAKRDNDKDALKIAMDEYHTILVSESDDSDAHLGLADAAMVNDDKETAMAEAKKAVELNPDSLGGRKLLAKLYIDSGDKEAAAKELKIVIDKDPSDSDARKLQSTLGPAASVTTSTATGTTTETK